MIAAASCDVNQSPSRSQTRSSDPVPSNAGLRLSFIAFLLSCMQPICPNKARDLA